MIKVDGYFYDVDNLELRSILEAKGIEGLYENLHLLEVAADYENKRFNSDMIAYESQLDELNYLLHDVLETLEDVTTYIEEAKRIDKDKIYKLINHTMFEINNIL